MKKCKLCNEEFADPNNNNINSKITIKNPIGAQNKNRTCTPLREHGPQPCASTISAIWAKFGGAKIINFKTIYRLVETILT